MNTFLPFSDFERSARCLDKRRCFKQVVECYQLLNILDGKSMGWRHHPALKMWVGYRDCLQHYYNIFYDYCLINHKIKFVKLPKPVIVSYKLPLWMGYEPLHIAYRANLLRKGLEDILKGRNELMNNLNKCNIWLEDYDIMTPYVWNFPVQ